MLTANRLERHTPLLRNAMFKARQRATRTEVP